MLVKVFFNIIFCLYLINFGNFCYAKSEQYQVISTFSDINIVKNNKNKKYGLINNNGQIILSTEFEDIQPVSKKNNRLYPDKNLITITKNNKKGLYSINGQRIIFPIYKEIYAFNNENYFCIKDINSKIGLIYLKKNQLEYKLIELLPCVYDEIQKEVIFQKKDRFLIAEKNKKIGIIRLSNKNVLEITPFIYDKLDDFYYIKNNIIFILEKDLKYNFVYMTGETITNNDSYTILLNNPAIFKIGNGKKYAVINLENKEKTDFIFDDIKKDKNNNIKVKYNGKWHYLYPKEAFKKAVE
ncbi:WG repeat-containing protein, partial [bacterium]|nr:WG repeat-containing protein [bacterium]